MLESMSDVSEEADEYEAGCDDDASPKSIDGPLETMHTDTATVELGQEASDGEDSESDAPYSPELDTVLMCVVGCLCARFRRRPPCGWSDWRNSLKSGSEWESSAGMTGDSRWHSACRLRMLSRTSIDARLPCTNREVQSDLNGTEIGMALAQGGTKDWRVLVFP